MRRTSRRGINRALSFKIMLGCCEMEKIKISSQFSRKLVEVEVENGEVIGIEKGGALRVVMLLLWDVERGEMREKGVFSFFFSFLFSAAAHLGQSHTLH